jgi:hypothetical protein
VNEDVASAVPIEDELRRPAYIVRIAQVDHEISGAVEDDHSVVGCEPFDNRTPDGTGAASHDRDAVTLVGFAGHQTALRSSGLSIRW